MTDEHVEIMDALEEIKRLLRDQGALPATTASGWAAHQRLLEEARQPRALGGHLLRVVQLRAEARGAEEDAGAAAGITNRRWTAEDLVEVPEAYLPKPEPRGTLDRPALKRSATYY